MGNMSNPDDVIQDMVDDLRSRVKAQEQTIAVALWRKETLLEALDAAESKQSRYETAKERATKEVDNA